MDEGAERKPAVLVVVLMEAAREGKEGSEVSRWSGSCREARQISGRLVGLKRVVAGCVISVLCSEADVIFWGESPLLDKKGGGERGGRQ